MNDDRILALIGGVIGGVIAGAVLLYLAWHVGRETADDLT